MEQYVFVMVVLLTASKVRMELYFIKINVRTSASHWLYYKKMILS